MIVFRAYADDWRGRKYAYVEVRVAKDRKRMHADMRERTYCPSSDTEGQCSGVTVYRGKFALMWLNAEDLKKRPAEMVAHECVHAAMRHITNKRVDLSDMSGEEDLCYVAGSLTQQINDRLHKRGVFA